jgi:hypothetical protein
MIFSISFCIDIIQGASIQVLIHKFLDRLIHLVPNYFFDPATIKVQVPVSIIIIITIKHYFYREFWHLARRTDIGSAHNFEAVFYCWSNQENISQFVTHMRNDFESVVGTSLFVVEKMFLNSNY